MHASYIYPSTQITSQFLFSCMTKCMITYYHKPKYIIAKIQDQHNGLLPYSNQYSRFYLLIKYIQNFCETNMPRKVPQQTITGSKLDTKVWIWKWIYVWGRNPKNVNQVSFQFYLITSKNAKYCHIVKARFILCKVIANLYLVY